MRRLAERIEHLAGVVSAQRQPLELLVRQVLDHLQQARIGAPEVRAHIVARLDGHLLVFTVDHLAHALDQQAVGVLLEQRIPLGAPDALDDVPAGAAEHGLQLLDDLSVPAHRAVEALQVAVDDEDEVVELLARRQRNGTERLGLVGFAVAQERPHLRVGLRLEAAVLEVAVEARLVDGHDGPQAHRYRRELPEIGHQPRMRIGRQSAAGLQFAAEVLEVLRGQTPFEKRPRIHAGRAVALEEHHVSLVAVIATAEEVVVAHLIQRRRRGEGRDVTADAVFHLVGAHDHGHRVPADQALDAALDLAAARIGPFLGGVDGVDVGGVGGERQLDAGPLRLDAEVSQQAAHPGRPSVAKHIVERIQPLTRFNRFQLRHIRTVGILHTV